MCLKTLCSVLSNPVAPPSLPYHAVEEALTTDCKFTLFFLVRIESKRSLPSHFLPSWTNCTPLLGASTESWRAASPPWGTALTVATLTEMDRKSVGCATRKRKKLQSVWDTGKQLGLFLKSMERLTVQHEWTEQIMDALYFSSSLLLFLSCFITSCGHFVRNNSNRTFRCPLWGRSLFYNPLSFSFWRS